jgi:hypothetical protein
VDTNQYIFLAANGTAYIVYDGTNIKFSQSVSTTGGMTSSGGYYTGANVRADGRYYGAGNAYPHLHTDGGNYVYFQWSDDTLLYNISDVLQRRLIYGGNVRSFNYQDYGGQWALTALQTDGTSPVIFVNAFSDRRLKENIIPTQVDSLSLVNSINLKQFDWTDEGLRVQNKKEDYRAVKIGIIAQEIQELFPEIVSAIPTVHGQVLEEDLRLVIRNEGLIPYLIGAIQQQQKQIDKLQEKDAGLQTAITALQELVQTQQQAIGQLQAQVAALTSQQR